MLRWSIIFTTCIGIVVPTKLKKMRAQLANLNHCVVSFLSRAAVNLTWYDSIYYTDLNYYKKETLLRTSALSNPSRALWMSAALNAFNTDKTVS